MPGFSEEDIRKVREANDLVGLFSERTEVKQRGRDFWCCCPFHQEKTPSCKIDPVSQTWHCFGCGEGGDAISYVRKLDDVGFVDAVRFLARRGNVQITETQATRKSHSHKARLKELCTSTARFYHMQLMRSKTDKADQARAYLASRGFGGDTPREWELGFAPGHGQLVAYLQKAGFSRKEMLEANIAVERSGRIYDRFYDRVMFPIFDIHGQCIAFGGRVIGQGEPKYLNSSETPLFHKSEVLYGLDRAKAAMASTGNALIVEGYTDVIALHNAGFMNVVATLGTALTRQHLRILSHHAKKRITYVFDGDEAGQRAADRALGFIDESITPEAGGSKVDLYCVVLPDNLDPAEMIDQRGREAFEISLNKAVPLLRYGIDRRLARYDLQTPEGRSRATVDALSILAPIKDSLLAKDYAIYIASCVHAREQDVLDALAGLSVPQTSSLSEESRGKAPIAGVTVASHMSTAQISRIKSEREFLSLLATNPAMASDFISVLSQTFWTDALSAELSGILLEAFTQTQANTAMDIYDYCVARFPDAANIVTSSTTQGFQSAYDTLVFLERELRIGDLEQTISSLKADMTRNAALSSDERNAYFQSIYALQNQLNELRKQQTE